MVEHRIDYSFLEQLIYPLAIYFNFRGLQVNDIHQADSCKVTPAKFSGSKEVVPLNFRKQVSPLNKFNFSSVNYNLLRT